MTQPPSPSPTATYRLQLQPDFPFAAAARAVPQLAALGVSHLHLSPVLEAVPGSPHGYDVTGHHAVRAELGGEDGLRALAATARAHGLGLIVDIVPNHMAVPVPVSLNEPLWHVLRDGPRSPYARWFDIDWDAGHGGRMLLPVLAGRLGDELPRMRVEDGVLRYQEHTFPLRPGTEELPLPRLLDAQWYRLAWWRLARSELNYRRFFTISDLIGLRAEDPEVFDATHGTVLRLIRDGVIDGLRVDHPDGLADPARYLARLRTGTGGRWTVVEKILTDGERLPDTWACAGTTGYDALRHIDGLFVCPQGSGRLFSHYRDFTTPLADEGGDWEETVRRAAYEVLTHDLAAEVERLVRTAARIDARRSRPGDHAPWALRRAIVELLVRLPVYRPYPADPAAAARDAALLDAAAEAARGTFEVPEEARTVDLIRDLALGREVAAGPDRARGGGPAQEGAGFAARFAQTASALHAKSVEDTAFYRYPVLLSACEVGGDPGEPSLTPEDFHAFCTRLQRDWPATSTVLSTHDTKRSADVRARIAVLSECPDRWRDVLGELSHPRARTPGGGRNAPLAGALLGVVPRNGLDGSPPRDSTAPRTTGTHGAGTRTTGTHGTGTRGSVASGGTSVGENFLGATPLRATPFSSTPLDPTPLEATSVGAPLDDVLVADPVPSPPDPMVAWLAWQTAFGLGTPTGEGTAPRDARAALADRLVPAIIKSVREAGLRTSWTEPDTTYEEAVAEFVRSGPGGPAAAPLAELGAELAPFIRANVLGAALLHLTMPGVPDLYQGTEREYAALVDPDNRQPPTFPPELLAEPDAGTTPHDLSAEKLRLTTCALRLRRARPECFSAEASYRPLRAEGPAAEHCVAFRRGERVLTVVTRLSLRLVETGGWWDTVLRLPGDAPWRDLLTDRTWPGGTALPLTDLLAPAPVALLTTD